MKPRWAFALGVVVLVAAVVCARTTFLGPTGVTVADRSGLHAASFPYRDDGRAT